MTIDWPQRRPSSSPSVRAMMSTAPPGGNGTRMRTGCDGNVCADAPAASTRPANAPSNRSQPLISFLPCGKLVGVPLAGKLHRSDKASQGIWGSLRSWRTARSACSASMGPRIRLFTEIIGKRTDIRFDLLKNDSPDDVATPILAGAHAYQSGSARDELAEEVPRRPGPAAPHAEPADRLDQRRRLRHRQPEGLHGSRHPVCSIRRAATRRRSPSMRSP